MTADHYNTPMSILEYVLDRLRPDSPDELPRRCKSVETPDDDPRGWSPEDGGGYIPEEEGGPPFHENFDTERPTAEGQSIPSSVDPHAPSNFHFHGDDVVGAKKPTEPITLRCMNCDETMEFDPVRGPPRLNWLSRKFNHGGHYCGVINSIRHCCATPRYYEDSIGGDMP